MDLWVKVIQKWRKFLLVQESIIVNNIFNDDFRDFLEALNIHQVEYVLVGGYSVILHGYHRVTGDLDVLVNPTTLNYQKLMKAFFHFGLPINAITENDFINNSAMDVFTFGRPPIAIDIMTAMKGFDFDVVFAASTMVDCESLAVRLIHINHLKQVKKNVGRFKDLDDLENLK